MVRFLLAIACVALFAGCAHVANPSMQAKAQLIPLAQYVEQLRKIEVVIGGKPHDFLFDTGGGYTLISPEVQEALGCAPSGKLTGFRVRGERLDFQKCGEIEIRIGERTFNVQAGLFDINALLPDALPDLYGVLSMQTFAAHAITLDLAGNRLVVETPATLERRIAGMQPLDASFYNELEGRGMDVYLKVDAAGKKVYMLLDSGGLGGNMLTAEAFREITGKAATAGQPAQDIALRFGAAGSRTLPVAVRSIIREGLLGVDFVESAVFTFDFPNRRAWVTWNNSVP